MTKKNNISNLKKKAIRIADILQETYPDAGCELTFSSPLQVLIATILSAQCTDVKVNQVTPVLFSKYRNVADFAAAPQKNIEEIIRSLGLYRNKAKNIIKCCKDLSENYGGKVPSDISKLTALAGVGRKTANCVLVNAFNKPGLMTDTHFCRITARLGLTENKEPVKIERDLAEVLPAERWGDFSHQIIIHGRRCCTARNPNCKQCPLTRLCNYYKLLSEKEKK